MGVDVANEVVATFVTEAVFATASVENSVKSNVVN